MPCTVQKLHGAMLSHFLLLGSLAATVLAAETKDTARRNCTSGWDNCRATRVLCGGRPQVLCEGQFLREVFAIVQTWYPLRGPGGPSDALELRGA
mmetsp:Transcript_155207/g.496223  ORF Transcript_155207/g.496223 Transcript_155207/m.496223 type:complete len:95 (-) Transcript_155207:1569-1853(-)